MLVLAAVWWAWEGFAWLTNSVDPKADRVRLVMFAAMGAMLLVALATPGAFDDDAWLFGGAYLAFRLLHVALYVSSATDPGVRHAGARLAPGALATSALILAAAAFDGTAQGALWCAAIAVDYGWLVGSGVSGWEVHAGHFAERHGLIVLIALGESIVSIGVGAQGIGLGAEVGLAPPRHARRRGAVVGLLRRRRARGRARPARRRAAAPGAHGPRLLHAAAPADDRRHRPARARDQEDDRARGRAPGRRARRRPVRRRGALPARARRVPPAQRPDPNRQRLVSALVLLALVPVARSADALVALALVAVVLTALIAFEAIRFREARARIRSEA